MAEIGLIAAFLGGIVSFLSPCVLPLIPAFLSYLSGISATAVVTRKDRLKIFLNAVSYVLGFALVFSILGVLINGVLSNIGYDLMVWLGRVGGVIIILFGLYLLGLLKFGFLARDHKFKPRFQPGFGSSFLFGASFAVGWTPCVGAVLGTILTLAVTQPGSALGLLLTYSLGLGIPFLLVGLFTSQAAHLIAKSGRVIRGISIASGILLIVLGILVFTNSLSRIANTVLLNRVLLG